MPLSPTIIMDDRRERIIAERSSINRQIGPIVRRIMDRYAEVCRRELPELTEWSLVLDVLRRATHEPASACGGGGSRPR